MHITLMRRVLFVKPTRHAGTGKLVKLPETIAGFKGVLEGKYDDLPEVLL